jgi:hypothetical protein
MTLISTVLRYWMDIEGHKPLTAAMALGVDETTICNWLMSRTVPRDSLRRLALALCLSGLDMSINRAHDQLIELAIFDRQHPQRLIRGKG